MGSVVGSATRLIDNDGDPMDSGGALQVKLVDSTDSIDIGNVDLMLDGGVPLLGNTGAVAAGVLRVTLASDDPAVASLDEIESAIEAIEGAVDGSYLNVNMNLAGSDAPTGGGAESGALRVTIANDSTGVLTVDGTVTVASLDTSPATFDTVTSLKIDTADDTSWHRLHSNTASKEVQIQSLSTNVDIIYLGKYVDESSEVESIELVPAASISLPLSNLNLLSYKKSAHTTINQYLLVTVLTNA